MSTRWWRCRPRGSWRPCATQVMAAAGKERELAAVGVGVPGLVRARRGGGGAQPAAAEGRADGGDAGCAQLREGRDRGAGGDHQRRGWICGGDCGSIGKLDSVIRVWTLGVGIGYGRYPLTEGVWEGGHTVVTLDDKENYCGCGGRGHLEGIMGHRAMRLRFLDMEPEEVFEAAKEGDTRCLEFKRLWHKALAAATATSIHLRGPGRFFLAGFNVRFLDMPMLKDYLQQMVKMSPLQSYSIEIVEGRPGDTGDRRGGERGAGGLR